MQASRRNVVALSACQALLVMNNVMMISIGTLAADALAGNKLLVTLPATSYIVGAGLTTLPMSHFMKRHGRRAGFMIGCLFGIAGAIIAATAVALHQFWLLCAAALVSGVYNGSAGFYRFAAADTASPEFKSKAISLVLAGGIVGGVLGPESSKLTRELLGPVFFGSFLSLIALAAAALLILRRLDIPLPSGEERAGVQRPLAAVVSQPVFIVAALGAITAYGVMNLLMAAAPLAMQMCGHGYNHQVLVIEWHIVAMFAPAFVTGWIISRVGVLPVMFAGLLLKLAAVWIAVTGLTVTHFWLSMVLVGVGWCFLFVGGTTLLTEAYTPSEKAKAQGTNDLMIYLTMSTSSLLSGGVLYRFGWNSLNLAALPLLALTGSAILWLVYLRRSQAARPAIAK